MEFCCLPGLVSYYYNITERKNVSTARHGLPVRNSYICCPNPLDDGRGLQLSRCRAIQLTISARDGFKECMKELIIIKGNEGYNINVKWKGGRELFNFRLSKLKLYLKDDAWRLNKTVLEVYLQISFELQRSTLLAIQKLSKEAVAICFISQILNARESGRVYSFQQSEWLREA